MIDDNMGNRRQSAMVLVGILLVVLAIAGGIWFGMKSASSAIAATPRNTMPESGVLPNSSGIGKGETIISKAFYARPPPVFDVMSVVANTASLPLPGASGPAPASRPALSSPTNAEVVPAGWAGAGASLDRMWESNAAAAWSVRSTPLTAPNWRISGVVQRGEQTQILVQFDGEPTTRFFKVGDELPGGGKLAWVKPNVIGVSFPKKKPLAVPLVEDPFQPASSAGSTAAPAKARP